MTRHPLLTRLLHWSIAALILWQMCIISAYKLTGGGALLDRIAGFGPSHGAVGLLVLPLAGLRLLLHPPSPTLVARLVHAALRLLVLAIPLLGLLRSFGGGKGWNHWGLQIVPATGVERGWMVALGNAAHGELAWALAALIALHLGAVLLHALRRDGTLRRMF